MPKKSRSMPHHGRVAKIAGLAALGLGAGLAVQRIIVGRARSRIDPFEDESYGSLPADRTKRVVSFDGAVLMVYETGPEAAEEGIIFLHGLALGAAIWHHQARAFADQRRCIFYDGRRHGRSGPGRNECDVAVLAKDLKAVLDRSGLKRVILVGHSIGGMTVLEFCRQFKEELAAGRVAGIVLVNSTYTDALKTMTAATLVRPLRGNFGKAVGKLLEGNSTSNLIRVGSDDISYMLVRLFGFGSDASASQVEFVRSLVSSFPAPDLVETIRAMSEFDMEDALAAIEVPTLIIAGAEDRITSVWASERMADEIQGSELVVLAGTGHTAMMERPAEFNEHVHSFIARTLEPKAVAG